MTARFEPLRPGEPIGVVALSGPVDPVRLDEGLEVVKGWGHPVIEAGNLRRRSTYLAGSDDERVEGLGMVLAAGARWIMAARGGYGCTRLLPSLPLHEMRESGVSLIGYSDLTSVLNPLSQNGGAVQVHGPMAAAGLTRKANARRLLALLRGELQGGELYRFPNTSVVRHGTAEGPVLGGNLSLLSAVIGTIWEPVFDGSILFLEEVDEPVYRLDRLLTHLRTSGRLRNVKALMSGSLRGCRPAADRAARWRELLVESVPDGTPVVVGLPFGHGARNMAFPIGARVEVDTADGRVSWS